MGLRMGLLAVIYLAGGCFWGIEEYFSRIPGVIETEVGYAQSNISHPDYEEVCSGLTGAVETVKIVYDPSRISLDALIRQYFKIIDPFSLNRQGNDIGTQYRTGVYYADETQKPILDAIFTQESERLGRKPVVQLEKLKNFYPAEEWHQRYLKKNPGGYCHIKFDTLKELETEASYSSKKIDKSALKKRLDPQVYHVTQENGTEAPFTGRYWNNHEPGIYVDAVSGEPLFLSSDKFDSGTGWPSFTRPVDPAAVSERPDHSHGMSRVEVRSSRADSHLGHVFEDGPQEQGGRRYCINSAALRFIPASDMQKEGYGKYVRLLR